MPFHFYCPQGHLLEGQEAHVGQQSQCPLCGGYFLIPAPPDSPAAQFSSPDPAPLAETPPPREPDPPQVRFDVERPPRMGTASAASVFRDSPAESAPPSPAAAPAAAEPPAKPAEPATYRISCPRGHELETPQEMLGQEALCPLCKAQFVLRLEDSVEYRTQQEEARRLKEERLNRFWLRLAIAAAAFVVLGAIAIAIVNSLN